MREPELTSDVLVYVVDDEDNVRDVVVKVVRSFGYETKAFPSAAAFLEGFAPDRLAMLLSDVHLGGGTGLDLFAELERRQIKLPTIFMTGGGTIPMSVQAMKAGAVEFLTKPLDWQVLRAALEQAVKRVKMHASMRAEEATLRELLQRLTPRETAVLPYVARGLPNKQIATELAIVEQTVKVHRARLMQKLGVESVADLVRMTERINALGIDLTPAADTAEPGA